MNKPKQEKPRNLSLRQKSHARMAAVQGLYRLKVKGEAGQTVTVRSGEILNPDGTLYTTNLRSAKCTDHYTLKGGETETYVPYFTTHGFRSAFINS